MAATNANEAKGNKNRDFKSGGTSNRPYKQSSYNRQDSSGKERYQRGKSEDNTARPDRRNTQNGNGRPQSGNYRRNDQENRPYQRDSRPYSKDGRNNEQNAGRYQNRNENYKGRSNYYKKDENDDRQGKNYGSGQRMKDSNYKTAPAKEKESQPDKFETIKRLEREKKTVQKKKQDLAKKNAKSNRPTPKQRRGNNIDWTRGYENGLYGDDDEDYTLYN